MSVLTFEGIIEHGQVKFVEEIQLPEQTKVYIVVLNSENKKTAHFRSPRLKTPTQIKDFEMQMGEEKSNA